MRRRGLRGNEDGLWWAVLAASRDLFLCLGVVLVGCDRAEAPAPTVAAAPVKAPVEAPEGTAARATVPSSRPTSTSTVGLPRESRISRATIASMVATKSLLGDGHGWALLVRHQPTAAPVSDS